MPFPLSYGAGMKVVTLLVGIAIAVLLAGLLLTAIKVLSLIALFVLVLALAYSYKDAKQKK